MNKQRPEQLTWLAFFGCAAIWGSTFLVIRIGNDALPPLWAAALRLGLAAILLNVVLVITRQRWPRGKQLQAAVWFGVLEFGGSFPLLYWAEGRISSGIGAIVFATCPVTAMLAARALGIEALTPRRVMAASLAFGGVLLIFWREAATGVSLAGLLAALGAAIVAPLAGIALERAPTQSAIGVNAVGTLIGAFMCAGLSFAVGELHPVPASAAQWFPVVYLAVFGSVGAFVMFAWLVGKWGTARCSFIGVLNPVLALILGSIFRHESFSPNSLLGAAAVLGGVALALAAPRVKA